MSAFSDEMLARWQRDKQEFSDAIHKRIQELCDANPPVEFSSSHLGRLMFFKHVDNPPHCLSFVPLYDEFKTEESGSILEEIRMMKQTYGWQSCSYSNRQWSFL